MIQARSFIALLLAFALAAPAAAQQIYRWTDAKGGVHITDTPPPASAQDVETKSVPGAADAPSDGTQLSYELAQAVKLFPVVLYTSPTCKDLCTQARAALNRRAVPFKEVQVWNPETAAQLKQVSGSDKVPVLLVGRSVQSGFDQSAYDALLDSARYPRAGILPPRAQAAPSLPEGYIPPEKRAAAKAEPAPREAPQPLGPYAPRPPSAER